MRAVLVLALLATAAHAQELRLARIFGDHMVLQQQEPIRIWGWAPPGAAVTVTLTQDAEVAAALGVEPPEPTEEEVTVAYVERDAQGIDTATRESVAGADGRFAVELPPAPASFRPTWIVAASGEAVVAARDVLIGEVWLCAGQSNMGWSNFDRKGLEAPSSMDPGLRYVAWHDSDYKPLDDLRRDQRWQPCTPEAAARFSAVPFLFGRTLHRYLRVPVGVINVARGGTLGQTWCMREELDASDSPIVRQVLADYDAETARWDDPAQQVEILATWERACDDARAAHLVKAEEAAAAGKPEPRLRLPRKPADPRRGHSPPAGLFNATVLPIRELGLRGVLYYQGENNNFMRWTRYEATFPRVVASFRRAFDDPELPFGCVLQPGWGTFGLDPEVAAVAEGYANVRDIQRRALAGDPHGGLIATYPAGNSYIHPGQKVPVAEYASRWALARVYGEPVVHRGNLYERQVVKDGRLLLYFDTDPVVHERWKHVENNAAWQVVPCASQGNAPFEGFTIAGADRRWYPANARHAKVEGVWTIELSSDLVPEPVAARYGWANWPTGNMVGREDLPLPTFRTDDWPLAEGVNYAKEPEQASKQVLDALRQAARVQALDRKLRQAAIDVPRLEGELHKGDANGQLDAKIVRLHAVLDELSGDDWLARRLDPDVAAAVTELRAAVQALEAAASEGD